MATHIRGWSNPPPPSARDAPPRPSPHREPLRVPFAEKRFEARESLLAAVSAGEGAQGETARAALHVAVAALVWLAVHLLVKENKGSGMLGVGAASLQLARNLAATAGAVFGRAGLAAALLVVAALHALAALAVPLVQLLTRGGRSVPSRARLSACLALYAALEAALLGSAVCACTLLRLPPCSGIIVMCEGTRLAMKAHAYLREKVVHGVTALAEAQARGRLLAVAAAAEAARRAASRVVASAADGGEARSGATPRAGCEALGRADSTLCRRHERAARRAAIRSLLVEAAPPPGGDLAAAAAAAAAAAPEPVAASELLAALGAPLQLSPPAAALVRFRDFAGLHVRAPCTAAKAAQPHVRVGGMSLELRRFAAFLFSPTMIYRDSYPRSPGGVDVLSLLAYASGFVATLAFMLLVARGMVEPALSSLSSARPATVADYFNLVFDLMAPAALIFLSLFFAVLHCWLNVFAVALRFADRRYYSAWWTASTWGQWYRRWNMIIGDWIHSYLFSDLQRLGAPRGLALAGVFLISGVLHELILAASLGFVMPALFVFFTGPGVALLWATRWLPPRCANVFLWLALSLGVSLLFVLYLDESVLRTGGGARSHRGPPRGAERLWDALVPRSWRMWSSLAGV